jgi:hypothetical protein
MSSFDISEIALMMIHVRDQMKIFHWQTKNYAKHIASDAFVTNLTTNLDLFIETIQGKYGKRLSIKKTHKTIEFDNIDDKNIEKVLRNFAKWLSFKLPNLLDTKNFDNTELLNIRDEILTQTNQTLYLFSLQ